MAGQRPVKCVPHPVLPLDGSVRDRRARRGRRGLQKTPDPFSSTEGLWIAISLVVYLVVASNEPSTPEGNDFLGTLWVAIPLGRIPLTFLRAYLPGGGGWWWLLRVVLVSFVGLLVASFIAASGVDYHDSRNSGLLGAPAYSLSIVIFLLVPLTLVAAVLVWKMPRARTR